ncbi:MAG TPA: hypothetical protein VMA34_11590 [Terracidiphilus sp.]|nr:hypothetical protein [Terracidiphilus sp.]
MVVVPLSKPGEEEIGQPRSTPAGTQGQPANLVRYAAAGTLVAGGALLLTGNRRAAMLAAAGGTALAMLDQQETIKAWWNALPGYLDEAQSLLGRIQSAVDDISKQRERLKNIFAR